MRSVKYEPSLHSLIDNRLNVRKVYVQKKELKVYLNLQLSTFIK